MIDVFFGVARASKSDEFMWRKIKPFVTTLFGDATPDSLNRVIALVSPFVRWGTWGADRSMVIRWVTAASAVPYTEEVGQSVVEALFQIAFTHHLRPHIPVGIWAWLNKRPTLPPVCRGRSKGSTVDVVRKVRGLRDIETLKSYLLLVWSEWDSVCPKGLIEMLTLIKEDFSGIAMGRHREDLIERLDHLLERLADRRPGHAVGQHAHHLWYPRIQRAKGQYVRLKEILLETDRKATEILTRTSSRLINLLDFTHSSGR